MGNFTSDRGIDAARRKFMEYLSFFTGLGKDPFHPAEWDLAAWVADQGRRGKSGPRRSLQSLAWAERAFDLRLGLSAPLVQSQRTPVGGSEKWKEARPARMATVEIVKGMEDLITGAPTVLLRCWAGAFAALAHGVLRWIDLQYRSSHRTQSSAQRGA